MSEYEEAEIDSSFIYTKGNANDEFLRAKESYLFKREGYRVILDKGEKDEVQI